RMSAPVSPSIRLLTPADEHTIRELLAAADHAICQPYPGDLRWMLALGMTVGRFVEGGRFPGLPSRDRLAAALGLTWPSAGQAWLGLAVARDLADMPALRSSLHRRMAEGDVSRVLATVSDAERDWLGAALLDSAPQTVTSLITMERATGDGLPCRDGPPAIARLGQEHLAEVAVLEERLFPGWARHDRTALRAALAAHPLSLVALDHGAVVGYGLVGQRDELGMLVRLAVDAPWQGRGIGGNLVRCLLATLAKTGAARLLLNVERGNERAQAFYLSQGFTEHPLRSSVLSLLS
ncbi:MAG TPA: GNAT family N-acetyltransferase, partial [Ktedonobacterales bacterium]